MNVYRAIKPPKTACGRGGVRRGKEAPEQTFVFYSGKIIKISLDNIYIIHSTLMDYVGVDFED